MRVLLAFLFPALTFAAPSRFPVIVEVSASGAPLQLGLATRAGQPLDQAALQRDVRALWQTKLYSDIQVSFDTERNRVHFQLEPAPNYRLRSVLFEPPSEKRELFLEPGAAIDESSARRMADELRRDLRTRGFHEAGVHAELIPVSAREADVRLRVDPGRKLRVSNVLVDGPLRKHVKALRPSPFLPGWSLSKAYTNERLAESTARLRSSLLRDGFFDARVEPAMEDTGRNRIEVRYDIDRGLRFHIGETVLTGLDGSQIHVTDEDGSFPAKAICKSLLDQRAQAERQSRLDFAATLEVRPLSPLPRAPNRANVAASVTASEPLHIRRIDFQSNARVRDRTLRKALRIEEANLLDSGRLRRSIARLNGFSFLQPVTQDDVRVTRVAPGQADVTFRVRKQDARRWSIGGPLGPMSLFGPIHGRLETRLPSWGRGLLDLSTYTLGGWLTSVPELVVQGDAWVWKTIWKPSLVLSRPALPGAGLSSGYLWSPQLTLKQTLAANGAMRFRSELGALLEGPPPTPPLRVTVTHAERGPLGEIVCRQGRSWTDYLRMSGKLALTTAGL